MSFYRGCKDAEFACLGEEATLGGKKQLSAGSSKVCCQLACLPWGDNTLQNHVKVQLRPVRRRWAGSGVCNTLQLTTPFTVGSWLWPCNP